MGNVNFNTNVTKTVDLNKDVFLDVNKDVFAFANVDGNLATAEASADAVGGGGQVIIGEQKVLFIPDANVTPIAASNAPQQVIANPNPASPFPDPAVDVIPVPASDTDFTNSLSRTLFADVLGTSGQADLAVDLVQADKITFDQGTNTWGNAYVNWDIAGGEDPFPLDDNQGIIQDFLDKFDPTAADPFEEVCYTFTFSDIDFDPGQGADLDGDGTADPATVRVSFLVRDVNDNVAIVTNIFVPGDDGTGFDDLSVTGAFAALIQEDLINPLSGQFIAGNAATGGIVLLGVEDDVDDNGNPVDLDNLASFQVLLEDDPTQVTDANSVATAGITDTDGPIIDWSVGGVFADENPSRNGTDAEASLIWTTCEPIFEQREGNLAETDTFAQVSPEGAFSFSESLAASDSFDLG